MPILIPCLAFARIHQAVPEGRSTAPSDGRKNGVGTGNREQNNPHTSMKESGNHDEIVGEYNVNFGRENNPPSTLNPQNFPSNMGPCPLQHFTIPQDTSSIFCSEFVAEVLQRGATKKKKHPFCCHA